MCNFTIWKDLEALLMWNLAFFNEKLKYHLIATPFTIIKVLA